MHKCLLNVNQPQKNRCSPKRKQIRKNQWSKAWFCSSCSANIKPLKIYIKSYLSDFYNFLFHLCFSSWLSSPQYSMILLCIHIDRFLLHWKRQRHSSLRYSKQLRMHLVESIKVHKNALIWYATLEYSTPYKLKISEKSWQHVCNSSGWYLHIRNLIMMSRNCMIPEETQ